MPRTHTTERLPSDSTQDARAPSAEARVVLGRYRLQRRLGAGGFGVVWLARDEHLERDVAVKVMPRDDGAQHGRVAREARAAARLNHPGIVALFELAEDEHEAYLVSELVPGRTMAELIAEGALSDRDAARIGVALCEALAHAHARGVVHRDIKPANVMVLDQPAAGAGFAKLADFGVAQLAGGEGGRDRLTRTGDVVGTLAYMSPEQAEGGRATAASDVYSLALTLFEAWTGSNPVRASGPLATARRLGRPLPPLGRSRPDLPAELCAVIDDALDADPEIRPEPAELSAELREAEPLLDDVGGLVEPATRERVGLTAATRRLLPFSRPRSAPEPLGPVGEWPRTPQEPLAEPRRRWPSRLAARAAAGLLAGALVLAALTALGPSPPFSAPAAAGAGALAVALLPRVGWLAVALAVVAWLVSPAADRAGTALLLSFALAPVPVLLLRAGALWSVPVFAPLLGLAGLAPAFVALAALAGTAWRRAGLAAAGFVWLAAAEAIGGQALLFGAPDGTEALAGWRSSVTGALGDAVWPLLSSPALAPALAWGAFAAVLPLLVRGRSTALDLGAAALWAAGLIAAHGALADVMVSSAARPDARGAVAGAVLGALAAAAAATVFARGHARAADQPVAP